MKSASLQYANALADVALSERTAEPVLKQLNDFAAVYAESAELRNVFSTPAVSSQQKKAIAQQIAERLGAGRIVRNFLFVVIDHNRTQELPELAEAFQQVIRERQGMAEAEVVSATELSEAQKKNMAHILEKKTGKKIAAKFSLNPALLGGAVVRIGDTIYDGSLRHRLDEMRAQLTAE